MPLPSHLAAAEVPVRLGDLLVRVHDEGPLGGDGLVDGLTTKDEELGVRGLG